MVRNPKDVIVSVTHYIRMVPGCQFTDGTIEEMAEMFMADKTWWVPYFDIVADSCKNRHKPNVFFMTYEELAKVGVATGRTGFRVLLNSTCDRCTNWLFIAELLIIIVGL